MNALELFAGIGGIALAEQMAGINVIGLSEIEDFPCKVLQKNFPTIPILRDVQKINKQSLRSAGIDPKTIDIISGGFPCQPFIVANSIGFRCRRMDKSQEERCFREFAQSSKTKKWQKIGKNSVHLLLSGTKEITSGSCRFWRNDDGLSIGMDRLRALGNAVVPQQVLPIFQGIVAIGKDTNTL